HFQSTSATFMEADKPLETPISISTGTILRTITCSVFFPTNEELPADMKITGARQLLVEFNAKGTTLPQLTLCFTQTSNQRPTEKVISPESVCPKGGKSSP